MLSCFQSQSWSCSNHGASWGKLCGLSSRVRYVPKLTAKALHFGILSLWSFPSLHCRLFIKLGAVRERSGVATLSDLSICITMVVFRYFSLRRYVWIISGLLLTWCCKPHCWGLNSHTCTVGPKDISPFPRSVLNSGNPYNHDIYLSSLVRIFVLSRLGIEASFPRDKPLVSLVWIETVFGQNCFM